MTENDFKFSGRGSKRTCCYFRNMLSYIAVFALSLSLESATAFVSRTYSSYDRPVNFHCPTTKQAINHIQSIHNNDYEDRIFQYGCEPVVDTSKTPKCYTTGMQTRYEFSLFYLNFVAVFKTRYVLLAI